MSEEIHVVFQRDDRASFDRLRSKLRSKLGVAEAAIDDGWSIWGRICGKSLEADEVVLIQGDRVMPGQRGVSHAFPGRARAPAHRFGKACHAHRIADHTDLFGANPSGALPRDRRRGDLSFPASPDRWMRIIRHCCVSRKAIERQVAAHPDQWATCTNGHGAKTGNQSERDVVIQGRPEPHALARAVLRILGRRRIVDPCLCVL